MTGRGLISSRLTCFRYITSPYALLVLRSIFLLLLSLLVLFAFFPVLTLLFLTVFFLLDVIPILNVLLVFSLWLHSLKMGWGFVLLGVVSWVLLFVGFWVVLFFQVIPSPHSGLFFLSPLSHIKMHGWFREVSAFAGVLKQLLLEFSHAMSLLQTFLWHIALCNPSLPFILIFKLFFSLLKDPFQHCSCFHKCD